MMRSLVSVARLVVGLPLVLGLAVEPASAWAQGAASQVPRRSGALPKELVGAWRFDKDDDAPGKKPPDEVITFTADGTFKVTGEGKEGIGGRCRVEGEEIVMLMLVDGNTKSRRRRFKLDAEGLHFVNSDTGFAHYVRVK